MTKPLYADPLSEIEFVPIKLFPLRIAQGWSMVPNYPLNPRDYVVLMRPPHKPCNNRSAARRSRVVKEPA